MYLQSAVGGQLLIKIPYLHVIDAGARLIQVTLVIPDSVIPDSVIPDSVIPDSVIPDYIHFHLLYRRTDKTQQG